ncbi:MAG: LLM class flavin-dependent oxidoreductase [Gammaproteobacteria bacterium AqS3]|nr:LLM class flavin-dependent oxidoreductase [Gammaproteobacteria bacterium AqS3]
MRHGIFLAPFHSLEEDPTLAIQRDLELVEWLDRLGYAEAWIGEHHSSGFEIIASPEVFIAAAAERTRRIRLGTGVVSLPYHNPLTTANRIVQLDHQTRGRVMFGVGPGLLPADAKMFGIEIARQRPRMVEGLEVILRLFAGETVTQKSDWFDLVNANLHLLPYTHPHPEIAVASSVTPSGGRLAGTHDLGMLCVAATQDGGYDALGINWKLANEVAAEHGRAMDRSRLRLVGPMHIAETEAQARENVAFGIHKWLEYFQNISPLAAPVPPGADPLQHMVDQGIAVIGTPDAAIAQLERLYAKQGEFGCFLQLAHNWADWDRTKKSYELFMRHVAPHFNGANRNREASYAWAGANAAKFGEESGNAALQAIESGGKFDSGERSGKKADKAGKKPAKKSAKKQDKKPAAKKKSSAKSKAKKSGS